MSKKLLLIISLFLLLSCLLQMRFNLNEVKAPNGYPVHNLNTGLNYTTIQEAIDAPETLAGHTIFVEEGIYYETVVVNKTISLIGENKSTTIIDGNMSGTSVMIWSSDVTVSGFTIRNGDDFGVAVFSHGCIIHNNIITNNQIDGVIIVGTDNLITDNMIANNSQGVNISLGGGNNTISGNSIASNSYVGVIIAYVSSGNKIFHNKFINNSLHAYRSSSNIWDNGFEGNYWSNYNGTDTDHDGIGNTTHVIDANNTDNYPLMGMFSSFNTSLGHYVNVISNSTVEDFAFFESNSTIKMHVSNMTTTQTFGFCRVCIPKNLMSPPYTVVIDDGITEALYFNETIYDNGTHRWVYFAYQHSTHEIIIIPELPSFLILRLFMIATLLAVIIYIRKHTV